jgi:3'(2'), 5'-bisphosphate nucleotidase
VIKLPKGLDIHNLIDDLRIFSWEAADLLIFYSDLIKNSKDGSQILENGEKNNPVTKADLKVNELIIKRINEKYKNLIGWGILSEENVKISTNSNDLSSDWLWVFDPLDGTKDFLQRTGNYAMHLALNYKNKPCLGVVLIPSKDELWISDGNKVCCEGRDGKEKRFHFSNKKSLHEMTLVTSKNHSNKTLKLLIDKINFRNVLTMGSIGCKVASIVRGESDIYISLSMPNKSSPKDWDFAAPEAILKSSGGAITNLYNQGLTYGKSNFEQGGIIVASNNILHHRSLCLEIKEIIKKHDLYPFPT